MKRIAFIMMAIISGIIAINAQKVVTADRNTGHRAYQHGESLTYTVRYGFVKGGEGLFTVRDTVVNGIKTNHIVVAGKTTGVADFFFSVRDSYESFVDPSTQLPVKAIRNISEGRYKRYEEVSYNRNDNSLYSSRKGQQNDMPVNILDMVSAFYHARNNTFDDNLTKGDTIFYQTYFAGEIYPLRIMYLGREKVDTPFGDVLCYKFVPITEVGRTFKNEDDMKVWISCDGNHVPVKIEFDLVVGSFVCELTKYKGMKYPLKTA